LVDGNIVTAGGRVLGMVGSDATLQGALDKAYALCKTTSFKGGFYRRDIAHRELARLNK
jgi:phosphoribosylamine--glycine ligase